VFELTAEPATKIPGQSKPHGIYARGAAKDLPRAQPEQSKSVYTQLAERETKSLSLMGNYCLTSPTPSVMRRSLRERKRCAAAADDWFRALRAGGTSKVNSVELIIEQNKADIELLQKRLECVIKDYIKYLSLETAQVVVPCDVGRTLYRMPDKNVRIMTYIKIQCEDCGDIFVFKVKQKCQSCYQKFVEYRQSCLFKGEETVHHVPSSEPFVGVVGSPGEEPKRASTGSDVEKELAAAAKGLDKLKRKDG